MTANLVLLKGPTPWDLEQDLKNLSAEERIQILSVIKKDLELREAALADKNDADLKIIQAQWIILQIVRPLF